MTRPTDEQIKTLRKGDVVTVRAVVLDADLDNDGDLAIVIGGRVESYARPSEIMTIEPREIKVGDRVKHREGHAEGSVRHIEGLRCAVLWDSGGFHAYAISELKVIP